MTTEYFDSVAIHVRVVHVQLDRWPTVLVSLRCPLSHGISITTLRCDHHLDVPSIAGSYSPLLPCVRHVLIPPSLPPSLPSIVQRLHAPHAEEKTGTTLGWPLEHMRVSGEGGDDASCLSETTAVSR